jgi:lipid A disaccharide synthetase
MKKYRRHKKVISKEKRQNDTINYSVGTDKKDFELKVQKKMQKKVPHSTMGYPSF